MWDKVFVESQFALLYKPPTLAVTIHRAVTMFTGNRMSDDKRGGNIYGLTILFAGNTSNTLVPYLSISFNICVI